MSNLVFCLMGPTASGKTGLACELAMYFPFELISVDSALIYREMNIGTAKPTTQELQAAPHHLIDIIDPIESYSAAQFCADVVALCASIQAKGKIPLLVGGTMMYFNALQQGLSVLPQANEQIRRRIEEEALCHGWPYLHQQLSTVDPQAAARIHVHDTQRIQRALEVYYLTGTSLTATQQHSKQASGYQFVNLILMPEQRAWLHERIALRFDEMLLQGFVDEVSALQQKWTLDPKMPSMRCVGYRQVLEYLHGDFTYSVLRDKGVAATRQLAKRQLTWLRNWNNACYYDTQNTSFTAEIVAKIQEILDNPS